MSGTLDAPDMARCGRRLMRRVGRAALATSLLGAPYASLVLVAADGDASPLLLLSDLARHSRNIAFDPRVSLLFDGATEPYPTLAGPRLSLMGLAEARRDEHLLHRFTARHPEAEAYAGFADFRLYRVRVERGQLVMGFGRIAWVAGADLLFAGAGASEQGGIAAAEPAILAEVNTQLARLLARAVARQEGGDGAGWRACGVDPEGLDLRCGDGVLRLEFASPVATPAEIPAALAELAGPDANNH